MKTVLSVLSSALFAAFAPKALASAGEPAATLACLKSYKAHASPYFEVFERQGMTFARTLKPTKAPNPPMLSITLIDGEKVYAVEFETPRFYGEQHRFRLEIPGGKAFCVSYEANFILNDDIHRFDVSPPASCPAYVVRKAVLVTGNEVATALKIIHDRTLTNMREQISIAKDHAKNPGKMSPLAKGSVDRMAAFNTALCKKVQSPRLQGVLREIDDYRKTGGAPAGESGTQPGHR